MKIYDLQWMNRSLRLGEKTLIMGILNITPDSFSDGGNFFRAETALGHARQMVDDGADILDIGGESSRPFSDPVTVEEECRRVLPVIEYLAPRIGIPISIDTTKAAVARRAIDAGATIINDISALNFDPELGAVAAETGALLILMHMKGSPKTMQVSPEYTDLIGEISDFLGDAIRRAESHGVPRSRIIIDPGIGFGKTATHNLQLIKDIDAFYDLDVPVLLGPSRKAFIRKVLTPSGQAELPPAHPLFEDGTRAVIAAAAIKGVHIVRVHDVAGSKTTLSIVDAIRNA